MAAETSTKRKWAEVATVTLLIGENKTAFHVHEAVLFEASPYFKAAFTSQFRESPERTMTLPEDDDSIFELFVGWLYQQRYNIPPEEPPMDCDRFLQPVQLFVLADKYNVRNLKNLVVKQIFLAIKNDEGWPAQSTIAYAYKHTPQNSPMREMLADSLIWDANNLGWFQRANVQAWLRDHPDISMDVILSFAKHTLTLKNTFDDDEIPEEYKEEE